MQSHQLASASAQTSPPPSSARLEALIARHTALSNKIEAEQKRPGTSDWYLRALKQQKLYLKEEIEGIATHSSASSS